jgi:pSer/pThr/pTyr-binding forkhead associated (FHA) protein
VDADRAAAVAYRIRVGADLYPLDAALYIGRRPVAPRIPDPVPPRLVEVPSPAGEVSRTHARIRQVGSSVVVTDLRSANGTIVIVPNGGPRTLRQGESMVVPAGAAIDLGDGNLLGVEAVTP